MAGAARIGLCLAAALVLLAGMAAAEPQCSAVWSISNSYTVASDTTSFMTLNLYLTNPGTTEITAPYNLTISNPAYIAAHSWNFQVSDVSDGVISGVTQPANAFWQTILPRGRNTVNLGGNVETTEVAAAPELIAVDGIECTLEEKIEGLKYGGPGELRPRAPTGRR